MSNDLDLLRLFDLDLAKAGKSIRWSHLDTPCTFVGVMSNGRIAVMTARGVVESAVPGDFRMKPLFWHEGKPVYEGDRLWHTMVKDWVTVDHLQPDPDSETKGWFIASSGSKYAASLCLWVPPKSPLITVEGKELFAGDKVWHTLEKRYITLKCLTDCDDVEDSDGIGRTACFLRLVEPKPLFVLKGKPVYENNRLWNSVYKRFVIVVRMNMTPQEGNNFFFVDERGDCNNAKYCRWNKPVTKTRYVNVYSFGIGPSFATREEAEADDLRDSIIAVGTVTWEE